MKIKKTIKFPSLLLTALLTTSVLLVAIIFFQNSTARAADAIPNYICEYREISVGLGDLLINFFSTQSACEGETAPPPIIGGNGTLPMGSNCETTAECAPTLNCVSCDPSTIKANQKVCSGREIINACGGYNVDGRVCATNDRRACGACDNHPNKQEICDALGQWVCVRTDRCGAVGNYPIGSECRYDSSCITGFCDRRGLSGTSAISGTCQERLDSGSGCTRDTECISNSCLPNGTCSTGDSPDTCWSNGLEFVHGGFMGCGLSNTPSNYDCFCNNGSPLCKEDLDQMSCGAPGGPPVGGEKPPEQPPEEPFYPVTPPPTTLPPTTPPQSSPSPTPTIPPQPSPTPTPPPGYFCNSPCSTDTQCQTSDNDLICSSQEGDRCRLETNPTSPQCQPPVGPMCLNLDMLNAGTDQILVADPVLGDTVKFMCAEVTQADHYIFRVIEPNGDIVDLQATDRISENYTIDSSGQFFAQCQICTGASADTCHSYESL